MLSAPARVKAVGIKGNSSGNYGVVDLYDGTSNAGTADLRLVAHDNNNRRTYSWIRIPGNGIRFSEGVYVDFPTGVSGGTDACHSIWVVYQD